MTIIGNPIVKTKLQEYPAKITKLFLGVEDHGMMTVVITVDYGGSAQGVGMYELDTWVEEKRKRVGTAFGMEFIRRILETVGVSSWDKLVGQPIFVLKEERYDKVHGIKGFPDGKTFVFKDLLDEYFPPTTDAMSHNT